MHYNNNYISNIKHQHSSRYDGNYGDGSGYFLLDRKYVLKEFETYSIYLAIFLKGRHILTLPVSLLHNKFFLKKNNWKELPPLKVYPFP